MKESKADFLRKPGVRVIEAGNTIYRIRIQDSSEGPIGDYGAFTGPDHPLGAGKELIFSSQFSSFNTFRSYTTMTDYTVDEPSVSQPPFTKVLIRQYATISPIGTTGIRTTYELPGPPETPDTLTIVQDVNVIGTTFENSYVEVRVTITNNGNVDTKIGIRYFLDTIVGDDDGPTLQTINPISPLVTNEAEFNHPGFEAIQMVDNDSNPNPPTYIVYFTVTGPEDIGIENPPTRIQYVYWFTARATAFDYTINPNRNISSLPDNDSTVLYYWGHNEETAITLAANGGSFTSLVAMFATKPGIVPPFINNNICIVANRVFDVCRQEVTHTKKVTIPSLEDGVLLGCKIEEAQCFVKQPKKTDNTSNTVQVKVEFEIDYKIELKDRITHVTKPFVFTTEVRLLVPESAAVSCELQDPTCESRQIKSSLAETTVHAFIKL